MLIKVGRARFRRRKRAGPKHLQNQRVGGQCHDTEWRHGTPKCGDHGGCVDDHLCHTYYCVAGCESVASRCRAASAGTLLRQMLVVPLIHRILVVRASNTRSWSTCQRGVLTSPPGRPGGSCLTPETVSPGEARRERPTEARKGLPHSGGSRLKVPCEPTRGALRGVLLGRESLWRSWEAHLRFLAAGLVERFLNLLVKRSSASLFGFDTMQ